jgi:FMN-dependent oxidoreductase (nitrilotriacetate monooxygenase family)
VTVGSRGKLMHLMSLTLFSPGQHSVTGWRHPLSTPKGLEWNRPQVWQRLAQELERGRFDALFFADQPLPGNVYQGSYDSALKNGVMFPAHDPLVLAPIIASVTSKLGIAVSMSTAYYHPFMLVRKLSTLDNLSDGRVAWNVVTSYQENGAEAFGADFLSHDERYRRADEYFDVCEKLWNSWEPDALVEDPSLPLMVDPSKVHPIEHDGEFIKCSGFPVTVPSPQHHPVIFQAGSSPAGRDFCAKRAEVAFAVMITAEQMAAFSADMAERTENAGRKSSDLGCAFGVQPIVAPTEAEARERQHEIRELVTLDGAMSAISGHTGFDFGSLDPTASIKDVPELPGVRGVFNSIVDFAEGRGEEMTVADAVKAYSDSVLLPQIVGSPEQVAEEMITLWEEGGGIGFLVSPPYYPGGYTDFVDLVVPILQEKGVYRKSYVGNTLREHLAQTSVG